MLKVEPWEGSLCKCCIQGIFHTHKRKDAIWSQEEMIMHLEIESTVIAAANPEGQVPFNSITITVMIISSS